VAFAFHRLGSFQVAQTNTSPGSVSGGHVNEAGQPDGHARWGIEDY